jgi:hypothetical protein
MSSGQSPHDPSMPIIAVAWVNSLFAAPRPDESSRKARDSAGTRRGCVGGGLPVVDRQHDHSASSASRARDRGRVCVKQGGVRAPGRRLAHATFMPHGTGRARQPTISDKRSNARSAAVSTLRPWSTETRIRSRGRRVKSGAGHPRCRQSRSGVTGYRVSMTAAASRHGPNPGRERFDSPRESGRRCCPRRSQRSTRHISGPCGRRRRR